jgi:hypothetical protein
MNYGNRLYLVVAIYAEKVTFLEKPIDPSCG